MGEDDVDPSAWIKLVGNPMRQEVEGIKRALWWASGSAMGAGIVLGLFAPTIMKKLGFG